MAIIEWQRIEQQYNQTRAQQICPGIRKYAKYEYSRIVHIRTIIFLPDGTDKFSHKQLTQNALEGLNTFIQKRTQIPIQIALTMHDGK